MTRQEQSHYERFLEDFEQLVNIDSSSDNPGGILRAAEFLRDRIEALGLQTEISRQGKDGTPCLKACTPAKKGRYDFLFLGHMDTVFPPGETSRRPFYIQGGRAYGPGVNDMKGGLLLAVHALEALKEQGALGDPAICLAFNGDEETGSVNSRQWIEDAAALCDRVLVFEACRPGFCYVLRRKGSIRTRIVAHGVGAHAASIPQKGINAVVELAHQICRINELNRPGSGITAQCTVVRGGNCVNIIPDRAEAEVDLRISTEAERAEAEAFFRALPETPLLPGAIVEVILDGQRPPMECSPATERLWEVVRGEAERIGLNPTTVDSGGCSDGNWTAALGIPTLDGMGPAGANSHSQDEYMELDSFLPALRVVVGTCKKAVEPPRE